MTLFLGPGFRFGARWNRLGETVKTRKKREKTGNKWARYGLKGVKESGSPGAAACRRHAPATPPSRLGTRCAARPPRPPPPPAAAPPPQAAAAGPRPAAAAARRASRAPRGRRPPAQRPRRPPSWGRRASACCAPRRGGGRAAPHAPSTPAAAASRRGFRWKRRSCAANPPERRPRPPCPAPVARSAKAVAWRQGALAPDRAALRRSSWLSAALTWTVTNAAPSSAASLYSRHDFRRAARTLFDRLYLAHFCSFFRRFFAVFSALTPGFQKVALEDRGSVP